MNHIAFYLSNLKIGGVQRIVVNLANELVNRGYQIEIVLVDKSGHLIDNLDPSVSVIDLDSGRAINSIPSLVRYLRTQNPDLLFTGLTYLNDAALIATILSRTSHRLLISEHNVKTRSQRHTKEIALARILYPRADHIVAVSEGVARDITRWTPVPISSIDVIHNPIVSEELLNSSQVRPDHPWYQKSDSPLIISAGRLIPEKDFETLIHAFDVLKRDCNDAKLVIIGDGPNRSNLESLISDLGLQDSVSLPGFVNPPYGYMRYADLFVLSSQSEGLGNVLIEAMAVGTPVVSTNCPDGPAEILKNGQYGRLTPVGDPEQLAEAISLELIEERSIEELQERAMDFSVKSITDKYLEIFGGN